MRDVMREVIIAFIVIMVIFYTVQTDKFRKLMETDVSTRLVACTINHKPFEIYRVSRTEFNADVTLIWVDGHDPVAYKLSSAIRCVEQTIWRKSE